MSGLFSRYDGYHTVPIRGCVIDVFSAVLLHTATANGFQMVTSGAQSKAISDWAITSLEVRDAELKSESAN